MADQILVNKDFYIKIETEVFNDAAGFGGYFVNERTNVQTPMTNPFEEVIDGDIPSPAHTAIVTLSSPVPSPPVVPAGSREIPVTSNTLEVGEIFDDGAGNMYRIKESSSSHIRIFGKTVADITDSTTLEQKGNTGIYKSKVNISTPGTYICVVENLPQRISKSQSVNIITAKKGFV